jgi:alcohol dehydrogenase class IV
MLFAPGAIDRIGGGSALDTAKAIALMAVHTGSVEDYQLGRLRFQRRGLPTLEWQSHIVTNPRPVNRALIEDVLLDSL